MSSVCVDNPTVNCPPASQPKSVEKCDPLGDHGQGTSTNMWAIDCNPTAAFLQPQDQMLPAYPADLVDYWVPVMLPLTLGTVVTGISNFQVIVGSYDGTNYQNEWCFCATDHITVSEDHVNTNMSGFLFEGPSPVNTSKAPPAINWVGIQTNSGSPDFPWETSGGYFLIMGIKVPPASAPGTVAVVRIKGTDAVGGVLIDTMVVMDPSISVHDCAKGQVWGTKPGEVDKSCCVPTALPQDACGDDGCGRPSFPNLCITNYLDRFTCQNNVCTCARNVPPGPPKCNPGGMCGLDESVPSPPECQACDNFQCCDGMPTCVVPGQANTCGTVATCGLTCDGGGGDSGEVNVCKDGGRCCLGGMASCDECDAFTCCTPTECVPGKCGTDGCCGKCNPCGKYEVCEGETCCKLTCFSDTGKQVRTCGDDGCGGNCGTCSAVGEQCVDGNCCKPDCMGKNCGSDSCGGSCGSCPSNNRCMEDTGVCCTQNCIQHNATIHTCGDDGCGGSCGTCTDKLQRCMDQNCCTASCFNIQGKQVRNCGDDGCEGSCGSCVDGQQCVDGNCCGGTCTKARDWPYVGNNCAATPMCVEPQATADIRSCRTDRDCSNGGKCVGGGSGSGVCQCGTAGHTCTGGSMCSDAGKCCTTCVDPAFPVCDPTTQKCGNPSNEEGKPCGDDGCNKSCGVCNNTNSFTCAASDGLCHRKKCNNKQCGDDGWGGSCGICTGGLTCDTITGLCTTPTDTCVSLGCSNGNKCVNLHCQCTAPGQACRGSYRCVDSPNGAYCCMPKCESCKEGPDGCGGQCQNTCHPGSDKMPVLEIVVIVVASVLGLFAILFGSIYGSKVHKQKSKRGISKNGAVAVL